MNGGVHFLASKRALVRTVPQVYIKLLRDILTVAAQGPREYTDFPWGTNSNVEIVAVFEGHEKRSLTRTRRRKGHSIDLLTCH